MQGQHLNTNYKINNDSQISLWCAMNVFS